MTSVSAFNQSSELFGLTQYNLEAPSRRTSGALAGSIGRFFTESAGLTPSEVERYTQFFSEGFTYPQARQMIDLYRVGLHVRAEEIRQERKAPESELRSIQADLLDNLYFLSDSMNRVPVKAAELMRTMRQEMEKGGITAETTQNVKAFLDQHPSERDRQPLYP